MAHGHTITITADGQELDRWFLRERYGADGLAESIAKHAARFRGEIWGAKSVTMSIVQGDQPSIPDWPQPDPASASIGYYAVEGAHHDE